MATPQAGQPVQVSQGDQLGQLANMLGTLFGTKATQTNTANTAPLQNVLAQLQGQDFQQMLQSIFAQAGGAIPGIQAAYGNAVGARSGNNSAVQANLERLMQQTTLLAQQQMAQQQAQNLQTQGQIAGNIAQGSQTQTTATKGQAGGLAGLVALTQGALKLTGSKDLEELWKKMSSNSSLPAGTTGGVTAAAAGPAFSSVQAPVYGESAGMPNAFSLSPYGEPTQSAIPQQSAPDFSFEFGEVFGPGTMVSPDMGFQLPQSDWMTNSPVYGDVAPINFFAPFGF
jgi:hypothetical protein